jgi:hypothetical protein
MGGDWHSMDGYRLGPYSVASAYHQSCNTNLAQLEVITHEIVHPFGIPDLYDFDGSLNSMGNVGGMGRYDGGRCRGNSIATFIVYSTNTLSLFCFLVESIWTNEQSSSSWAYECMD